MEFDANRRIIPLFMQFVCNLPRIMRLFDFGRNYAKNYASIIRQGLIHIHFVVLMEPQSSENCAFSVLASGHKYNVIHQYPHTKVSMHARDQHGKEKTLLLLFFS